MTSENPKEIFVVDDDPDYCALARLRLEAAGYRVTVAPSGREAMTRFEKGYRPDLILLDVNMDDQNGLTTVINLNAYYRDHGQGEKRVPIVISTALQSEKVRNIFIAKQVDDYIHKPCEPEELVEKIKRVLEKHS